MSWREADKGEITRAIKIIADALTANDVPKPIGALAMMVILEGLREEGLEVIVSKPTEFLS